MQGKVLIIVLLATGFVLGAYYLISQQQPPQETDSGGRLFAELENRLNDITRIKITQGADSYEVARQGDQWQLPGKGGYPVLFERVKPLLVGIALLEKAEAKTDKPENYARLGVQDPGKTSGNLKIDLYAGDNTDAVSSLIVGGVRGGLFAGGKDGIYVRISDEPRAWLVSGNLDLPGEQVDWVDRQIIHIKPKTVKRVTIKHPDGATLQVEKSHQGAPHYEFTALPDGAVLKDDIDPNSPSKTLAGLNMEDVFISSEIEIPTEEATVTTFETWGGLQVKAYSIEQNGETYAWFNVGAAALDISDLGKVKTMQGDFADMQTGLQGWVFQIPESRGEKLRWRLEDVIESLDTK